MMPLVHEGNREPIRQTAKRINRSYDVALRLCHRGVLAHQVDASGRYWSSEAAAKAFNEGGRPADKGWAARRQEVLG